MIKNQRQYATTKKQIQLFEDALAQWSPDDIPDGVDSVIHKAKRDGLESQLEALYCDLAEYEALQHGAIETISLRSLEELPLGLIKARIASGLTQRDLADRIGVKAQQVQRWEFEDYENVGFKSMVDIAHALGVDVSEIIRLPTKPRPAFTALKELGIGKSFILARLVPREVKWRLNQPSDADLLAAAAGRLERIFGCHIQTDGTVANDGRFAIAACDARFKLPADAQTDRVNAYALYARYLAEIVAMGASHLPREPITRDWRVLRERLCGDEQPSLERLLVGAWDLGVAVLPLSDPIRFHGVCWRIDGRNVVVIKQPMSYESRWAFDLIHEMYHAGESPDLRSMRSLECDATDVERRESEDERSANEFAGNVLLNGQAEELYNAVILEAAGKIERVKRATSSIAAVARVNQGFLANYIAHRLKTDHFIDWWGAAANLQVDESDPFHLARRILFDRLNTAAVSTEDAALLDQALSELEMP